MRSNPSRDEETRIRDGRRVKLEMNSVRSRETETRIGRTTSSLASRRAPSISSLGASRRGCLRSHSYFRRTRVGNVTSGRGGRQTEDNGINDLRVERGSCKT